MTIAVLIAAVALALIAYRQFQADAFVLYGYEVDSLHAIDSVARLASGDTPHVDYPTALGYLAFAPVSFFAHIGLPIGAAFVASQFLVAGCILLAALWARADIRRLREAPAAAPAPMKLRRGTAVFSICSDIVGLLGAVRD